MKAAIKLKVPAAKSSSLRKKVAAPAPPPSRVTVRLKPNLAERLAAERKRSGASVTEVVEQALDKYFAQQAARPKMTLLKALKKNKLIGCLDLGPDASANYKQLVLNSVAEKYGHC